MANNTVKNSYKNPEGYADPTPYNAIQTMDAVEIKAFKLYETIGHMARLAGFTVDGTIIFTDRNGRTHDGAALKREYKRGNNSNEG